MMAAASLAAGGIAQADDGPAGGTAQDTGGPIPSRPGNDEPDPVVDEEQLPEASVSDAHTEEAQESGFDTSDAIVMHWGMDAGGTEWKSEVMDASVTSNNDPANFAPSRDSLPAIAGQSAKSAGWVCSTWARPTVKSLGYLSSSSHEICSGNFLYHYTRGKFLRSSWSGPRSYTRWANSKFVYSPHTVNDTIWSIRCPGGGTYNYNLQVQTHLVDTRGDHGGPYEVGKYVRAACGT
ncbi:hypothetical protein [Streptomyces melanogenes]|uniref:hypothetical protein n=1 Tax=Streptomyces melanogenes TaxID=67326 RepID=UPI001E63D475|nr:hypothetical protein [Streptomyces melanogenes]